MNSEATTSPHSVHHTSAQNMNQEPAKDLKRKAQASNSESSAAFDLFAHDVKAQNVLCSELLNGEGADRLPGETDADLAARHWASWDDCKYLIINENLSFRRLDIYSR
jgi:hypothetical protein